MAKILVVDDNPTNRSYLVTLLGYGGHALWEASDGAEALALVSAEHPDLVISDILMPTMDGYELVRRLRSDPGIAQTPVIFCTAHFHERDANELARECGVAYVLTKPCAPKVVIEAVNECLARRVPPAVPHVDENFDREHLRLLTDKLSQQTSELTAANLRLRALLDIGLQLASETDPGRLLNRFCGAARDLIAARFSVVIIAEGDGNDASHLAVAGTEHSPSEFHLPTAGYLFAAVLQKRQSARLHGTACEPIAAGLPESLRSFDSLLVSPIVSPTRAYGWLCLFHRLGASEFGEEDERLAGILAALVGRVYENVRLYARERLHAAELTREIAERRRAQEESARLADIVHSSDDGIVGMTEDGNIVSWNRGAERVFGYTAEEVAGKPVAKLFDPRGVGELQQTLQALVQHRRVERYETTGIRKGGDSIEVAVTISPILKPDGSLSGVSALVRDITAQKRLQQQLLVAQKMEAIGRLSAGIAHDFNNLLTVVGGYSALLLGSRNEHDPDFADILEIHKAAEQASALTRQLLAVSRKQVAQPRALEVNSIVAEMDRMLRRVIGEDIDLETVLDPALGAVQADSGQLEQIVMNLVVNARDAMPDGGKLTIQTANLELQEPLSVRKSAVAPGEYVVLSVTDTGIGMDTETQDRIFEPFFTTKEAGRGTGLGLSTVYGIVEQCRGAIAVYSEPGQGTTFRIFLPRLAPSEVESKVSAPFSPAALPARNSETVLVVEDEDGVRALICAILSRTHYTVLEAKNGGEALLLCEGHPKNIDLMVSDITMPGMTGVDLAGRVRALRPEMKVLFTSGYAERAVIHQGVLQPGVPFLEKPFAPEVLTRKVRELLDSAELPAH